MRIDRRRFLALVPPALATLILAACGGDSEEPSGIASSAEESDAPEPASATDNSEASSQLEPTPACGDDDEPTIEQTEGPFFTPDSPERSSLIEDGMTGTPLRVSGVVIDRNCEPISNTLVDFWHADDAGEYDNVGYRLRGHQFTDDSGAYELETIRPGLYTGRTRHIHVKVQAPGEPVLTTQLYFPGEPDNAADGIFHESLLMEMPDERTGRFQFVLDV